MRKKKFFSFLEINKLRNEWSFFFLCVLVSREFIRSLLDDEVDEEIHEYDKDELAFHHVVKFVVTFELLFWNYDVRLDGYPRLVMNLNHHSMLD